MHQNNYFLSLSQATVMQQGVVITTTYPANQPTGVAYSPQQGPVGYVQGPNYHPSFQAAPVGYPTAGANPTNWQKPPPYATAPSNPGPLPTKQ